LPRLFFLPLFTNILECQFSEVRIAPVRCSTPPLQAGAFLCNHSLKRGAATEPEEER
jgi:hypothetical protein